MAAFLAAPASAATRSQREFCAVLAKSARALDQRTASTPKTDQAQAAMVVANLADFTRLLRRLDAVAPSKIGADMSAVREAWESQADAAADALSNPASAIASTLLTAVMASSSVRAIDKFAEKRCHQTVFGTSALAAISPGAFTVKPTPTIDTEGYTVIDARNVFGTQLCDNSGSLFTATSRNTLVFECGVGEYFAVDLTAKKVVWSAQQPLPETQLGYGERDLLTQTRAVNTHAKLLAFAELGVSAATGFDEEQRGLVVRAISLDDGVEQYRTEIPKPAVPIDDLDFDLADVHVETMGADGTVILRVQWPTPTCCGAGGLYGIAPDGRIAWQRQTFAYVNSRGQHYAGLSLANDPPDLIEITSGASVLPASIGVDDGTLVTSDACSDTFAVVTYDLRTGARRVHVLDAASGQVASEDVKGNAAFDITMTARGAYVDPGTGTGTFFETPAGVAWRLGPGLASYPTVKWGRFFMTNQSGAQLEVDQATGKSTSTTAIELPPNGFPVSGGLMENPTGLGIRTKFVPTEVLCG